LNCLFARKSALSLLILAFAWPSGGGGAAVAQRPAEITVSAAISMKDSLEEAAQAYHAQQPNVTVHFNLGASGTLQQQIEQGAPVDVFISASPTQMNSLESKGLLLAGTRKDLVRNRVVLIVPNVKKPPADAGAKKIVFSFQDLAKPGVKVIAVGEPQSVPAGKYAQEVLTHFGLYDQLKPKFVLGKDVRQVLTYVATGNADAGIVYATDALTTKDVTVAATAPEDSHSPVVYPIAAIKASQNPAAAKAFIEFLLDAKARAIFEKYGFVAAGS
jgi:molybdate transport system substrate-binding protein